MPGKCKFNDLWLLEDFAKKWLSEVKDDKYKAYCKICRSKFDISHSGIGSIKTHAKGMKHKSLLNSLINGSQTTFSFQSGKSTINEDKTPAAETTVINAENNSLPTNSQPNDLMKKYLLNEQVTKAEILWALNTILTHISSRSGGDASDLFKMMFPDSIIADKFKMHKDKLAYTVTYGLGPYFQDQLINELGKCDFFCLSLDESLNKVAQKGQMDVIVRFWDASKNIVNTRYLSSMFLGHSKASDLLDAFTTCLQDLGLPLTKILQVETDGPNVNLKFLRDFDEHIKIEHHNSLLDVGTCSLHVLHGCYKTALMKSGWAINDFLRAIYYLFKDFPSRRADYKNFSGSSLMPLKVCSIRWIENSNVIERAIKILPFLKMYVEGVKDHPPATKNFETVSKFIKDELLLAKLYFLQSVATDLEGFLTFFQADKPLLPHLYEELNLLFKSLASRFMRKDIILAKNLHDIMAIDINNKDNYLSLKKIEVGFGAAAACSNVSECDKISFHKECRSFLINTIEKLRIKSPLSKRLVKGLSCLSPKVMLSSDLIKSNRVSIALKEFVKKKTSNTNPGRFC